MTKEKTTHVYENKGVTRVLHKSKMLQTPSEKYRKKITQVFDKSKIEVTKAGVTYNVNDKIQEFEPQTNFYKVMEDYNCTPDQAMERMKGNFTELKGIIDQGKSYAEHLMEVNRAKEQFEALPVKIKQQFNNNVEEFLINGEKFLKEHFAQEMQQKEETKEDIIIGDNTNGGLI